MLTKHWKKVGSLPLAEDVGKWKLYGLDLNDLPIEQEEFSTKLPKERKPNSKFALDEAAVSISRDTSPQRKQPDLFCHEQVFLNVVSSAEKVPIGVAPASSTGIKCLISVSRKKVSGMQNVRAIPLKSPPELPKTCDLLCKEAAEKQGLGHLRQSKDQNEMTMPLHSNHESFARPRAVKHEADSMLQVATKRAKESSTRTKSHSVALTADLGVVIAQLVMLDTHVEATIASKNEIAANTYKLGYLDCMNDASPCFPLKHKDGEQLYLDLPPAQSDQINVVDVEAIEEQVADEVAIEEDNAKCVAANEVRANAEEQATGAVEQMVLI